MRKLIAAIAGLCSVLALCAAGWPTDHGDAQRSGWLRTQATFSHFSAAFSKTLDGAVYASPILVGSDVIVATENDTVYALDATTGAVHWTRHLNTPVPLSSLPCGNINPLGITGTPTYDAATNRIFLVTESPDPTTVARQDIIGLNATTGATEVNRRIGVPGADSKALQQRAALADDGVGNIYVAFGGLAGDCGNYLGGVVSLKASGALGAHAYVVPTSREGGIWAPGGPVVGSNGTVYVAVGNGAAGPGSAYDYSDSVTALNSYPTRTDFFAPSSWATDNARDLDLGSLTPALTSNGRILQAGKSGNGYLLNASHLGGIGGQIMSAPLCTAFGVSLVTNTTVYLPCTNGVTRVDVGSSTFYKGWTQPAVNGSPVAGNGALYSVGNGNLYALNGHTGAVMASFPVGTASRFATPGMGPKTVYVGTMTGIVAVNVA